VSKDNMLSYRASKHDCERCSLKPRCSPNAPARKVSVAFSPPGLETVRA
jgi:hypothetical protein